jgi:hypothetical protein
MEILSPRKGHNEKFIGGISPEMVERFVRSLHDRDLSHATINKYVAATPCSTRRLRVAKLEDACGRWAGGPRTRRN